MIIIIFCFVRLYRPIPDDDSTDSESSESTDNEFTGKEPRRDIYIDDLDFPDRILLALIKPSSNINDCDKCVFIWSTGSYVTIFTNHFSYYGKYYSFNIDCKSDRDIYKNPSHMYRCYRDIVKI